MGLAVRALEETYLERSLASPTHAIPAFREAVARNVLKPGLIGGSLARPEDPGALHGRGAYRLG